MARSKVQIGRGGQRDVEPQNISAELRGWIERVATEPGDAAQPLPTTIQGQHIAQMYQLADIFASIFEVLHDASDDAVATTREAA